MTFYFDLGADFSRSKFGINVSQKWEGRMTCSENDESQ